MKKDNAYAKNAGRMRLICLMIFVLLCGMTPDATACGATAKTALSVDRHSQAAINAYIQAVYAKHTFAVEYIHEPTITGAYSPGVLSTETLQGAVDMLNVMRYIAGIPDNVKLKDSYNQMCQAGAMLCAANKAISHWPKRPPGVSDRLYRLGKEGCGSANLYLGALDFREAVLGWVSDEYNISGENPGHRRWCLQPSMKYTGFGKVGNYSAMYCFDNWEAETAYHGVAWPAQQMPTAFFHKDMQWSVSFGRKLPASSISVKLTRQGDGRCWNFNARSADGQFLVNNENYGQVGCVIFKPKGVTAYQAGEIYHVQIRNGGSILVDYTVEFFALCDKVTEKTKSDRKAQRMANMGRGGMET